MAGNTARPGSKQLDYRTFGTALRDLLIERGITTRLGSPNWPAFAEQLPSVHYETLRKAVAGDRPVAPKIIQAVAKKLEIRRRDVRRVPPLQVRCTFDPAEVGVEAAFENLARWESQRD